MNTKQPIYTSGPSLYKLLIACFLAVLLTACGDNGDDEPKKSYTVAFDTDGGAPPPLFIKHISQSGGRRFFAKEKSLILHLDTFTF